MFITFFRLIRLRIKKRAVRRKIKNIQYLKRLIAESDRHRGAGVMMDLARGSHLLRSGKATLRVDDGKSGSYWWNPWNGPWVKG